MTGPKINITLAQAMTLEACMDRSSDDERHEHMKDLLLQGANEIQNLTRQIAPLKDGAAQLLAEFEHGPSENEIEYLVVHDPDLGAQLSKLALRFISKKGMSGEFLAILQDVQAIEGAKTSPEPF